MDRTSILGDTIDYMKELLEKINNLQEEMELGPNQLSLMSIFKDVKPNEMLVRNSPKVSHNNNIYLLHKKKISPSLSVSLYLKPSRSNYFNTFFLAV